MFSNQSRPLATLGSCAGFAILTFTAAGAQEPLFRQLPADAQLSARQAALVESAKTSGAAIGTKVMTVESQASPRRVLGGSKASKITLGLSDRTTVTANRHSAHGGVWRGAVDGAGGSVTLMWSPEGDVSGTVQHDGYYYSIRPLGDRLHAIVELDQDLMPPDHQPPMLLASKDHLGRSNSVLSSSGANNHSAPGKRAETLPPLVRNPVLAPGDVVIDVMIAYTKKASGYYNDIASDLIALAVNEANESFRVSGQGHVKLRLVHAYQTAYVEEGSHFDHVWRLADEGDGYMGEVHGLRNKYHADVAILIVDDAQGCGLAIRVHPDADEAFAVVHHECAATTHSLAHEIGHIFGARHELNIDNVMTPFPYGHGYVNGDKWRDIMSYKES
jgi:hypothetical protein